MELRSLDPREALSPLDLDRPGLEAVRDAQEKGDHAAALAALLGHYRGKYPLQEPPPDTPAVAIERADQISDHVFQYGPYESADYGEEVDWEWDPRGDIEWVASAYRFYWAHPLAQAYAATRHEKYAAAFVDLASDWIAKHPLEERDRAHPVYTYWRGFPWLDIQTGIRATNICQAFRILIHAESFTPEFLGVLLASLYDHQVKTEHFPMGQIHNKAIFEQRGFINVAWTFQELRDSARWLRLGLERAHENLLAQTTSDGVQREWSGGYHSGVLRDAVEISERMAAAGIAVTDDYFECVRRMFDYILWIATPDLGYPMFGDCARPLSAGKTRSELPLYEILRQGTEVTGDPVYAARAELDRAGLPGRGSHAFREAGMYVMRDDWGPEQIYFALHCSPPAISSHDQPDNGTFELRAFGRWLMTDSGFYTYGHDPDGRAWHRQTRVHQALTLNGEDSQDDGRLRLWHSGDDLDALVVENRSYEGLTHRRTVWFVDRAFSVLLDEAIGEAEGELDLHFQLALGEAQLDRDHKVARTLFDDANVLIWTPPDAPVTMEEEEGWFAWEYGYRKPRKAFRYWHEQSAPASFLTLLVPYRGKQAPSVSASLVGSPSVGADRVCVRAQAFGKEWELGRDLADESAWASPV